MSNVGHRIERCTCNAVNGPSHVVNDFLQAAVEHHIAGLSGIAGGTVIVVERVAQRILLNLVQAGRHPGGSLARQHRRQWPRGLRHAQILGQTIIDLRLTRSGKVLDNDIVGRNQTIAVVVSQEVEEDVVVYLARLNDVIPIRVGGQHIEQEHAQGVVQAAIDIDGFVQRPLDGADDIAAQIRHELRRLLQLIADDRHVQDRTERIQTLLQPTQHLIHRIDDDRRIAQQENQRAVDDLVWIVA